MPRTVDHEERRAAILDAFVAVAARDGLHAVSLRRVAAEAGISLRLVQYYFETKAGLLRSGLLHLERASNRRWAERVEALPQPPTARAKLLALFTEALPTAGRQRDFHILWTSYAMLSATGHDSGDRTFVEGPDRLQRRIEDILRQGRDAGEFDADIDIGTEACILLGLIHGLGTAVLIGQQTPEAAMAHLSHQVDRLGGGSAETR